MSSVDSWLAGLTQPAVYAAVGVLVFAEDALFIGFVLPGETAVVFGGFLASEGIVSPVWLAVVVVAAAILGDAVGFAVGRRYGTRILGVRPLRRHANRIEAARDLIRRRGAWAVFFGRFIAFFRATIPPLAGMSGMPFRRFVPFNILGGIVWGVGYTLLGYLAGGAYRQVESVVGTVAALVVAALVVVAVVVWRLRGRRRRADEGRDDQGS